MSSAAGISKNSSQVAWVEVSDTTPQKSPTESKTSSLIISTKPFPTNNPSKSSQLLTSPRLRRISSRALHLLSPIPSSPKDDIKRSVGEVSRITSKTNREEERLLKPLPTPIQSPSPCAIGTPATCLSPQNIPLDENSVADSPKNSEPLGHTLL